MIVVGCDGGKMTKERKIYSSLKEVPASKWEDLSTKIVYFGHQSVGNNIIDGIKSVIKENPEIHLNIVEQNMVDSTETGVFLHSKVGENRDPKSKMKSFEKNLQNGIGSKADIAALKFCYVDLSAESDPELIFNDYKATVEKVKRTHKDLKIIHFTVPLTVIESGFKAWVKNIIGRPLRGMEKNIRRSEYNELLKKEYSGKDPIFDIANIESTAPDGRRSTFSLNGKTYECLLPEYATDGGHLNQLGRTVVAGHFLLMLANQL
jgi:hypothetical protein